MAIPAAVDKVQVSSARIGESRLGRPLHITRVHASGAADSQRPSVLIVAGIDPRHAGSTEVAAAVADRLAIDHAPALERGDVYVLSRLNPDGFEQLGADAPLRAGSARNRAVPGAIDADRDGRSNEDPPADLDGDGRILQMRIRNPAPGLGLRSEYVAEAGDPRILRPADAAKSERPIYALLAESRDADGDGLYGEDGFDGVQLDRNFPYHWPEFRDEAGRFPMSEPETRALADWLLAHDNVVAVLAYAPSDNLVNIPPGDKKDETGAAPAGDHILKEDRPLWERVGARFKEITHQKEAPTGENAGTLQGWAYAQLGLWSFSTPVWVRPDQCADAIQKPGPDAGANASPGRQGASDVPSPSEPSPKEPPAAEPHPPASSPTPAKVDSEDGKWIAYSDSLVAAGKPGGFVPWKSFRHPQLGEVEIGGWVPGFRQAIPVDDIPRLAGEQAAFVADLLNRLPRLAVIGPRIERLGETIWRISVEAVNEGELPTRTRMGVQVRRLPPTRWVIEIDGSPLLAGDRAQKSDAIPGGGSLSASWTINANAGETVKLALRSPECGDREIEVRLESDKKETP